MHPVIYSLIDVNVIHSALISDEFYRVQYFVKCQIL